MPPNQFPDPVMAKSRCSFAIDTRVRTPTVSEQPTVTGQQGVRGAQPSWQARQCRVKQQRDTVSCLQKENMASVVLKAGKDAVTQGPSVMQLWAHQYQNTAVSKPSNAPTSVQLQKYTNKCGHGWVGWGQNPQELLTQRFRKANTGTSQSRGGGKTQDAHLGSCQTRTWANGQPIHRWSAPAPGPGSLAGRRQGHCRVRGQSSVRYWPRGLGSFESAPRAGG